MVENAARIERLVLRSESITFSKVERMWNSIFGWQKFVYAKNHEMVEKKRGEEEGCTE